MRRAAIVAGLGLLMAGCPRERAERGEESVRASATASATATTSESAMTAGVVEAGAKPALPPPTSSASAKAAGERRGPGKHPEVPGGITPEGLAPPGPGALPHAGFPGPVDPGKDGAWLDRLEKGAIVDARPLGGGTSVTLKLRFADGRAAVLKPDQRIGSSNFRAEIAAYHLDRLLGLGRTAPVAARTVSLSWLRAALDDQPELLARIDREVLAEGDRVRGALIAWHERPLALAEPPKGWLDGLGEGAAGAVEEERLGALSDLLVFDLLLDNTDRWSGGNVLSLGKGGPIVFLDNASALLGHRARLGLMAREPIERACRFRKATIDALRASGPASPEGARLSRRLSASLARYPGPPLLSPPVLDALDARVAWLLVHVERCASRLGEQRALGL